MAEFDLATLERILGGQQQATPKLSPMEMALWSFNPGFAQGYSQRMQQDREIEGRRKNLLSGVVADLFGKKMLGDMQAEAESRPVTLPAIREPDRPASSADIGGILQQGQNDWRSRSGLSPLSLQEAVDLVPQQEGGFGRVLGKTLVPEMKATQGTQNYVAEIGKEILKSSLPKPKGVQKAGPGDIIFNEEGVEIARGLPPVERQEKPLSFDQFLVQQIKDEKLTWDQANEIRKARGSGGNPYFSATGIDPTTGKMVKFDHRTGETSLSNNAFPGGIDPKVNPTLPAGEAARTSEFQQLIDQIGTIENLYDDQFVGALDGRQGQLSAALGTSRDATRDSFLQSIATLRNFLINLRSGAAVTPQEYERLTKELPDPNTSEVTFKARLEGFKKYLASIIENRNKSFRGAGFRSPGNTPTEQRPAQNPGVLKYNPQTGFFDGDASGEMQGDKKTFLKSKYGLESSGDDQKNRLKSKYGLE